MICLPCLFVPSLAFYASLHACYMSMHESCLLVCRPYFNSMKPSTFDPNLHLCLTDTPLVCFLASLSLCLFACFLASLFAIPIMLICFMPFHMLFASFPSIVCQLVSCLCLCMYTHGARTYGAMARSPRQSKKGQGCKHVDLGQVAVFSRFRSFVYPFWLCTLLNPFFPLPFLS